MGEKRQDATVDPIPTNEDEAKIEPATKDVDPAALVDDVEEESKSDKNPNKRPHGQKPASPPKQPPPPPPTKKPEHPKPTHAPKPSPTKKVIPLIQLVALKKLAFNYMSKNSKMSQLF